jgi:hypothetical protein
MFTYAGDVFQFWRLLPKMIQFYAYGRKPIIAQVCIYGVCQLSKIAYDRPDWLWAVSLNSCFLTEVYFNDDAYLHTVSSHIHCCGWVNYSCRTN